MSVALGVTSSGERESKLECFSSQHDELEKKFFEERVALEAKYQKLYEPLYSKRYEIGNGVTEVEGVNPESALDQGDNATEEKGVPDFWLTAMKTNEVLSEEISERDEGALKYLKDIKWSRIDEPKGFKLEFFFNANSYFKNYVLTKTYHMIDDDEPILEKAIGTEIDWYPGKSLTQKILKKKPRKGSKNAKPITKTEDCESFFNFFNPLEIPDTDDGFDEETAEELHSQMEQDYDIGYVVVPFHHWPFLENPKIASKPRSALSLSSRPHADLILARAEVHRSATALTAAGPVQLSRTSPPSLGWCSTASQAEDRAVGRRSFTWFPEAEVHRLTADSTAAGLVRCAQTSSSLLGQRRSSSRRLDAAAKWRSCGGLAGFLLVSTAF
ncbi:PREDICTED: nucleosome assembly protein 1-like 1-like [Fragaria vesca subsp. vesca]